MCCARQGNVKKIRGNTGQYHSNEAAQKSQKSSKSSPRISADEKYDVRAPTKTTTVQKQENTAAISE
jgi:hypothetical protein